MEKATCARRPMAGRAIQKKAVLLTLTALLALTCLLGTYAALAALGAMSESGARVFLGKGGAQVDLGHTGEGYVSVLADLTDKELRVRITRNQVAYTYTLSQQGNAEAYPLQLGDGRYKIEVLRQIKGSSYEMLAETEFDVRLDDFLAPYRTPNQFVNYRPGMAVVAKARELCANAKSEKAAVDAVLSYIKKNIKYDNKKAKTVKTGYLPNLDQILSARKGICFDYASLMAAMLRDQGIPTQLVIGYVNGTYYHAWNKVFVGGTWQRYDPTFVASGYKKAKTYREERWY